MIDELYQESMESVKYNPNPFLKDLFIGMATTCVTIYSEISDPDMRMDRIQDILVDTSSALRKHTGVDLNLELKRSIATSYTVEVEIPREALTPSSMFPRLSDKDMDKVINGEVNYTVEGTMDLKEVKVTGIFSKIGFKLNLGVDLFKPDLLNTDEIAAIILHEFGHIWDFLSNVGEVTRTISVDAYARKVIHGNYTLEKKLDVIKGLGGPDDIDDPSELGDEEIGTLVSRYAFARNKTMQASVLYSKHSEEFIADSFPAMYGLSYSVATAMRKLDGERFFLLRNREYRPMWVGALSFMFSMFELSTMTIGVLNAGSIRPLMMAMLAPILAINYIPFIGNRVAIKPSDRLKKLREVLISALKDPDTSSSEKKKILDDLGKLDKELKNLSAEIPLIHEVFKMVLESFLPANRSKTDYKTRMTLDALDNNRLHEMTQRLKLGK